MRKHPIAAALLVLAALLSAGCTAVANVPAGTPAEAVATPDLTADDGEGAIAGAGATTLAALSNLSYPGVYESAPVTLTNGVYTYTDATNGDQFFVRLLDNFPVFGDLDGEDGTDAVAVLELETQGSGRFTYLAPVLDVWNTPRAGIAVELGDRVALQSVTLADGQVVVDYIGHGPGDGDCCPTYNRRNTYVWQEGGFVEMSNEELGQAGAEKLEAAAGQPALPAAAVDELAAIPDEDLALFQAASNASL